MTLFSAWIGRRSPAQEAVVRGQAIFNSRPITISGAAGLNDATGLASIRGACTTCHNTPNVGNHSVSAPLDIGITDASRRTPDQPLYTFKNTVTVRSVRPPTRAERSSPASGSTWARSKGRSCAAWLPARRTSINRAAASLDAVVEFYNSRFNLGLSSQEHRDLVAFLRVL
jgi:cytochrome c peroxidase